MNEEFLEQIKLIVEHAGYECVNVSIITEGAGQKRKKLQILIDTLGGISVDDCEFVSKRVNKFLDENDQSATTATSVRLDHYYLEVSSPGIERPLYKLEDYSRFEGREVRVRLNKLIEGRKTFTGIIKSVNENKINLICSEFELKKEIPFELIKGGNLVYRFEELNKKNNSSSRRGCNRRKKKS